VDDTAGGVFPPVTEDPDTSTKIWKQEIYRDVGYVWFAASLPPGSDYGIPYANGILATVSFSVLDRGGSILDLDDTILGNSPPNGGINMEHEVLDGVFSNAGIPPVAGFVASKYEAYGEEPITFDAIGPDPNNPLSYDPDGTIVSYHWDFGDGTSLTTTTPYAEYSYALLGVFTVGLTVTDNRGVEDYYETSIIVYAPTTLKADLTEWKAKPRYKVLDISRRETTVNTFFADVANLCNITDSVKVKVTFTVLDADAKLVRIVETNEYTFGPNTYLATTDDWAIQYGWHGLNTTAEATGLPAQFDAAGLTLGRFYVTAKASYKLPGDIDWTPGTAKKAFSFVVKP